MTFEERIKNLLGEQMYLICSLQQQLENAKAELAEKEKPVAEQENK